MTDEQQRTPPNSFNFAAIGWAVSIAVTAIALATGMITVVQFIQQKSVTLEAEFYPSEIGFAEAATDQQQRESQLSALVRDAVGASSSYESLVVQGKGATLTVQELAHRIAADEMKRISPLALLPLPPTGQMRIVITNSGELPAKKVRVFVPDADIYMMKQRDGLATIPHTVDGVEIGQINQGRSIELFAFTRYGYSYGSSYCLFECELAVAHEDGLGNVTVRAPRALIEAVMSQGFAFFMLLGVVVLVGLVGTAAMVVNGLQQAYRTVTGQRLGLGSG